MTHPQDPNQPAEPYWPYTSPQPGTVPSGSASAGSWAGPYVSQPPAPPVRIVTSVGQIALGVFLGNLMFGALGVIVMLIVTNG